MPTTLEEREARKQERLRQIAEEKERLRREEEARIQQATPPPPQAQQVATQLATPVPLAPTPEIRPAPTPVSAAPELAPEPVKPGEPLRAQQVATTLSNIPTTTPGVSPTTLQTPPLQIPVEGAVTEQVRAGESPLRAPEGSRLFSPPSRTEGLQVAQLLTGLGAAIGGDTPIGRAGGFLSQAAGQALTAGELDPELAEGAPGEGTQAFISRLLTGAGTPAETQFEAERLPRELAAQEAQTEAQLTATRLAEPESVARRGLQEAQTKQAQVAAKLAPAESAARVTASEAVTRAKTQLPTPNLEFRVLGGGKAVVFDPTTGKTKPFETTQEATDFIETGKFVSNNTLSLLDGAGFAEIEVDANGNLQIRSLTAEGEKATPFFKVLSTASLANADGSNIPELARSFSLPLEAVEAQSTLNGPEIYRLSFNPESFGYKLESLSPDKSSSLYKSIDGTQQLITKTGPDGKIYFSIRSTK